MEYLELAIIVALSFGLCICVPFLLGALAYLVVMPFHVFCKFIKNIANWRS